MIQVLMIEDDPEFAALLTQYLHTYNISITNYEDPYLGLSAGIETYDLLILDLSLPGMDGLEVCKEISQKYNIPIVISSARSDVSDKVIGLQLGADDYLPKPYDPKEMYARIMSLLRRYKKLQKEDDKKSDFYIDARDIFYKDKALNLTMGEYEVLSSLINAQGSTLSRAQIINAALSMQESEGKSLDVLISRLRAKLGEHTLITTVRGIGYRLVL